MGRPNLVIIMPAKKRKLLGKLLNTQLNLEM